MDEFAGASPTTITDPGRESRGYDSPVQDRGFAEAEKEDIVYDT